MTGAPGKAKLRKGVSLGHAFWQIGSLTAVSRVVGFIRDISFASFLGAGTCRGCLSRGIETTQYVSAPNG